MELIITILLFITILISDTRVVLKKKDRKVNYIYLALLFFSFVILVLYSLNVEIPSPSLVIEDVINSFI